MEGTPPGPACTSHPHCAGVPCRASSCVPREGDGNAAAEAPQCPPDSAFAPCQSAARNTQGFQGTQQEPISGDVSATRPCPSDAASHSLLAFPLESNFSGARLDPALPQALPLWSHGSFGRITVPGGSEPVGSRDSKTDPGEDQSASTPSNYIGSDGSTDPTVQSCTGRCSKAGKERWWVLLDAAKACATSPPDLSRHPADFVVRSPRPRRKNYHPFPPQAPLHWVGFELVWSATRTHSHSNAWPSPALWTLKDSPEGSLLNQYTSQLQLGGSSCGNGGGGVVLWDQRGWQSVGAVVGHVKITRESP